MTGTPIQNKLQDFGTLLRFLRVSPFNSEALFYRHIIKPLKMGDPDGLRRLRTLVGSTCLRRNKTILDLPPRIDQTQYVHFKPADRHLYETCKKDSAKLIEYALRESTHGSTYFGILQSILRLRLLCNHGKELLPAEVGSRLGEYSSTDSSTTSNNHTASFVAVQDPNIAVEARLTECNLCNELFNPAEVEADSLTAYPHAICNSCLGQSDSYPSTPRLDGTSSSIYAGVREHTSDEVRQPGLRWLDWARYSGPSTKVQALMENLRNSKMEGGCEPVKRYLNLC